MKPGAKQPFQAFRHSSLNLASQTGNLCPDDCTEVMGYRYRRHADGIATLSPQWLGDNQLRTGLPGHEMGRPRDNVNAALCSPPWLPAW
jgi:hypothetical protein